MEVLRIDAESTLPHNAPGATLVEYAMPVVVVYNAAVSGSRRLSSLTALLYGKVLRV